MLGRIADVDSGTESHGPSLSTRNVGVAAVLLVVLQAALFHPVRHDDAYVTYRYGQNLVVGRGMVFNPGEPVMGFTSPAHVLLSAAGYGLVGREALPSLMSIVGCVGWTAQAWAVLLMARLALPGIGAIFVALCVALGAAWSQRFVSLETNLAMAAVLWVLVAAIHRRWLVAAALIAVAGLFRPDAYLVAVPVGALCLWELRGQAWRPALLAAALTAPWLVYAWYAFGSVIPQSAIAKVNTMNLAYYRAAAAQYVSANLVLPDPTVQMPRFVAPTVSEPLAQTLTVVVWLAGIAGAALLVRRVRRLWLLPACGLLYFVAYLVLRPRIGMEWHLYPVLLCLACCVLALVAVLLYQLPGRRLGRGIAVGAFVLIAGLYGLRMVRSARVQDRAFWYGAREQVYRSVARYLGQHARPGDSVYAGEVGTLAYFTDLPMVENGGVITPDLRDSLRRMQPRWVVSIAAYPVMPCPRAPALRVTSEPIIPGEIHPLGHDRFMVTVCDMSPLFRSNQSHW